MRPAQLLHRHIASQPGKHDLELLLRRKRPVLPLLAQPDLLLLVERPILRGPPDAIAAPPRPYGPRLHANRASNKPQAGKCLPATGVQASWKWSVDGVMPVVQVLSENGGFATT